MAKSKDLILDDYFENDYEDEYEYQIDYDYGMDTSEFVEDYDVETYANYEANSNEDLSGIKEKKEIKKKNNNKDIYLGKGASIAVTIISACSNWFSIFGIVIAIILILVFLFTLQFKSLVLYLVILISSFFFGYLFMYFLDRFTSNN